MQKTLVYLRNGEWGNVKVLSRMYTKFKKALHYYDVLSHIIQSNMYGNYQLTISFAIWSCYWKINFPMDNWICNLGLQYANAFAI